MSVVSILNVSVKNNPAKFSDNYEFEITFEALEHLQKDLEFKLLYVGSATSTEYDQELDSLLVGPVPVGVNKFVFEADAPNLTRIPNSEIIGVTVILLTCSYDGREFVRVGYYVNNEYTEPELNESPPAKPIIEKIRRNILAEKPRVTRFAIKWDSDESAPPEFPPEQPEADNVEDDEAAYGAEEAEEEEVEEGEAAAEGEDAEMGGTEEAAKAEIDTNGKPAPEEEDGNESEDIGDDSEDEEDEEDEGEQENGEGEQADEDMEVEKHADGTHGDASIAGKQQGSDVMVH